MARRKDPQATREIQYLRAAIIHVERMLRYNTDKHYSITELADMHMIRKRWIRQACIESPNVKAIPHKGKTRFQYDGTPPAINPYCHGQDPDVRLKAARKKK